MGEATLAESDRVPVLTGGCQCGKLRYALYATPFDIHLCHCRMCQKAVAGPYIVLAGIKLADFAWTRGTPASFASSTIATRDFCAACGTPLSYRPVGSDHISITVGSLDRPELAAAQNQYGIESRWPWLDRVPALPGASTESGMAPELLERMVNHQHPDHDTPPDWRPRR